MNNKMIDEKFIDDNSDDDRITITKQPKKVVINIDDAIDICNQKALDYLKDKYLTMQKKLKDDKTYTNDMFLTEIIKTNNQFMDVTVAIQNHNNLREEKKKTKSRGRKKTTFILD